VSEIQYLPTARGATPARRSDDAHTDMAFPHANGACATIVINIDLVRVVGW